MALDTRNLRTELVELFKQMREKKENSDEEYAEKFSNILERFVKTGEINTEVITTGSSTTQRGLVRSNII